MGTAKPPLLAMQGQLYKGVNNHMANKKAKRSPETFMYRVTDSHGTMSPADRYTHERVVGKGYRDRDLVVVTIRKPRNPRFHRMVHVFCRMVGENVVRFDQYVSKKTGRADAHGVLRCLLWEADVCCEHTPMNVLNVGMVDVRVPRSIAFDQMDEGEFSEVYSALCEYVARVYWPGLTQEQIEEMERLMPE